MEKTFKLTVLALLLIISILLLFNGLKGGKSNTSSKIDTLYIKTTKEYHTLQLTTEKLVPFKVEIPGTPSSTIIIPTNIDSSEIIKDYFTKRHYFDSIKNDSVTIYLTEDVFKNELKRIKVGYRWTVPQMIIKETKLVEKQLVFVGAEPHGNLERFGMYISADFDTKKALFGYGFDPFNMEHKISVKAKLKLWNKKIK